MKTADIELNAQIRGIKEAMEEAEKLSQKINEAKTMARELSHMIEVLELAVEMKGQEELGVDRT